MAEITRTEGQSIPKYDAGVRSRVSAISEVHLEKTVRRLAAFPTRHTLSGAAGVDAAADYLIDEFAEISRTYGNRLQVERDTWTQPAGKRIPQAHELTNVIATLPGTETPERVIIVSGHYDSRAADVDRKSVV